MNLSVALFGWKDWPTWVPILILASAAPAWLLGMIALIRFMGKHGVFYSYEHPVLYNRWAWWMLIWPTTDEPKWVRQLAMVAWSFIICFFVAAVLRWGFVPS